MKILLIICQFSITLLFISCGTSQKLPKSYAETKTNYGYIPLDPLPIFTEPGRSCLNNTINERQEYEPFYSAIPDHAVRLAIGAVTVDGSINFGPLSIGIEGNSYQVILDYINVDVTYVPVYVSRLVNGKKTALYKFKTMSPVDEADIYYPYLIFSAPRPVYDSVKYVISEQEKLKEMSTDAVSKFNIPVYIGIGLRITANVFIKKGQVNLSSLGSLGAAASAGSLSGSMVIQTLGITGKNVTNLLPLPSEINQTSIENAILAIGSIKAKMYDAETYLKPRVVGIYNPISGGQEVVDNIISILASEPVTWYRPCVDKTN